MLSFFYSVGACAQPHPLHTAADPFPRNHAAKSKEEVNNNKEDRSGFLHVGWADHQT